MVFSIKPCLPAVWNKFHATSFLCVWTALEAITHTDGDCSETCIYEYWNNHRHEAHVSLGRRHAQMAKNSRPFIEHKDSLLCSQPACHWTLSWARWIQSTSSHRISFEIHFNDRWHFATYVNMQDCPVQCDFWFNTFASPKSESVCISSNLATVERRSRGKWNVIFCFVRFMLRRPLYSKA
jgi:hypothetical protein